MKDITTDLLPGAQLGPKMRRSLAAAIPDMLLGVDRNDSHGGTTGVTSRVGEGRTFEIVFPATAITTPLEMR